MKRLSGFCLQRKEVASQTARSGFMVKFQDVTGKTKEEPFHGDITFPPGQEPAKAHIFFGHSKGTLGLDGAVDAQETAMLRGDALLHFIPLAEEIFVYVEGFRSVRQRFFAGAFADTLFFAGTTTAVFTAVNGSFSQKSCLCLLFF